MRQDVQVIIDHFNKLYGNVNSAKKINIPEQIKKRRWIVENYGSVNEQPPAMPPDVKITKLKVRSVPCEWICAKGSDPNKRLLYIHGGAFFAGSLDSHRALSAELSQRSGVSVLAADYRLAPEFPFPAGLDDCFDVYDWLLDHGPEGKEKAERIFIAGDSAGGNLALAVLFKLKKLHLRMPDAVLPVSPVVDFAGKGESIKLLDGKDPVINGKALKLGLPLVYLFGRDLLKLNDSKLKKASTLAKVFVNKGKMVKDPQVSPIRGDLKGFPPIMINVGEMELLRDDAVKFTEKAKAQGVEVSLKIWPDMMHVFIAFLGHLPEAEDCLNEMAGFIRKYS